MAKALVIAEKPSLGRSIVSAISWWKNEKFTRQGKDRNTWLESDNYIVASSVGHLYELIDLDAYFPDYDPEKRHPWTMDRLPFFPDDWNFQFEGKDNVKGLIRTLDSLMNRKDVDVIYNAGDPDREGQRLVDEIIEHGLKSQKTIYRLWLPDTTNKTIKQAFETAKPNENYTAFSSSAETRSEMDWLLGIELTRYASIKAQGFIRIGRCVCPIVQHVIEREKAIKEFVPKPYSAVTSKEKTNGEVIELTSKRTFEEGHEAEAQALADAFNQAGATVTSVKTERKTVNSGKLFSMSDLQSFVQNMFKRPHKKVKQEKQPQQQAPRQNVSQTQQQSAAPKVSQPSEQKPAPKPTATPTSAVQVPVAKPAAKPQPPVQKSAGQSAKVPTAPVSQNVRVPVKQNQPTQRQSAFALKPPVAAHPTAQPSKAEQKPAPTPAPAQATAKPTPPPQPKKAEIYDGFAMAMMQHKTAPKPKPNIPAAPVQPTVQPKSEQTAPAQPVMPSMEPVHHKAAAPIIEKTVPEQPVENLEVPTHQEPVGEPVSVSEQQEASTHNAQWPVGMGGPQFAGTVKDVGETPRTIVAEEANVFFASCYDAATKAAAYGLCIDMGSDAVLLTKRSTAPNEVEHVLNGAIEMFNALKEHGVHDVVIYTDARVAQYMSENASRLLNGRSEVCRRYIDMAWNTMTSVSVRFVTSPVKSEYAQLTASTVNCFIKPRV